MIQAIPVSAGSGSATVTPVAVPCPPFETLIVNPTTVPAVTEVASAVLTTDKAGGSTTGAGAQFVHSCRLTTMVALDCTLGALEAEAKAVLGSEPEVAPVVGLVMWML